MENRSITFEIKERLGMLDKRNTGWTLEVNLVSWNGQPVKYDIREWDPEHQRMSKGITLTEPQMSKLITAVTEEKAFD